MDCIHLKANYNKKIWTDPNYHINVEVFFFWPKPYYVMRIYCTVSKLRCCILWLKIELVAVMRFLCLMKCLTSFLWKFTVLSKLSLFMTWTNTTFMYHNNLVSLGLFFFCCSTECLHPSFHIFIAAFSVLAKFSIVNVSLSVRTGRKCQWLVTTREKHYVSLSCMVG